MVIHCEEKRNVLQVGENLKKKKNIAICGKLNVL